jgi:hypothetical protein
MFNFTDAAAFPLHLQHRQAGVLIPSTLRLAPPIFRADHLGRDATVKGVRGIPAPDRPSYTVGAFHLDVRA